MNDRRARRRIAVRDWTTHWQNVLLQRLDAVSSAKRLLWEEFTFRWRPPFFRQPHSARRFRGSTSLGPLGERLCHRDHLPYKTD